MRNPAITILKAIAIMLVVLAHSGSPAPTSHVAYMLCVSLFFLSAGYCFNPQYLHDAATFVGRRFKSLYVPFVTWSTIFLLLNQFWFSTGILNEQCGNAAGGVTHPLSLHDGLQSFWSIIFNMSGYDQFLCGAYWFFRALLVSNVAFLVLMRIVESWRWCRSRLSLSAAIVGLVALGFVFWQVSDGLKVTGLAQGGYREFMGVFFLSAGFLYRRFELWLETEPFDDEYEGKLDSASEEEEAAAEEEEDGTDEDSILSPFARPQPVAAPSESAPIESAPAPESPTTTSTKPAVRAKRLLVSAASSSVRMFCATPFLTVPLMLGIVIGVLQVAPPSMSPNASDFSSALLLAVSGVAGFSLVYNLSRLLNRIPRLNRVLCFIGNNTLYVLLFHLLAFKLVSMLKVAIYGLPWNMIGGHPVVHTEDGRWFWLLYTVVGLALPLGIVWALKYCSTHYDIHTYIALLKAIGRFCVKLGRLSARWIAAACVAASLWLWKGLHWLCVECWTGIYNFCIRFVDTVKDGADFGQDSDEADLSNDDEDDEEDEDDDEEEDDEEDDVEAAEDNRGRS